MFSDTFVVIGSFFASKTAKVRMNNKLKVDELPSEEGL